VNRACWILLAVLLLLAVGACEEEPEYEGEGGIFDNPVGIAVRWPYVYVTSANFDLSQDKVGRITVIDMRIALAYRDECVVNSIETTPYLGQMVITADGSLAYVAERRRNSILIYDMSDPTTPKIIDLDEDDSGDQGIRVSSQPFGLALTADESKLFAACIGSGDVSIIDLEQRKLAKTVPLSWGVNDVKIDPLGRYAYVTNKSQLSVVLLDVTDGSYVTSFDAGYTLSITGYDNRGLAFTPDGSFMFVAARNPGSLLMVDTDKLPLYPDQAVLKLLPMDLGPTAVAVTPDGSEVWATNFDSNNVFVFEATTGTLLEVLRVGDGPYALAFVENPENPGQVYALTANFYDHNLTLMDARTKEVIWAIP